MFATQTRVTVNQITQKSTKSYEDKVETQKRGQPDKTLKVGLGRRLSQ